MKKLLFVLAFSFIGQQAFSQMYIVTLSEVDPTVSGCSASIGEGTLTITEPSGAQTYTCITVNNWANTNGLSVLNTKLNSIPPAYKLIKMKTSDDGFMQESSLNPGTIWIFAIPWTASGLEEVATTLKSFIINPNPTNTFVDISLDYFLKGESEVVFISEGGYISHKESIGEILKNEKYNIDISKIPPGKYLVTIVNGNTYTTPQKIIVL